MKIKLYTSSLAVLALLASSICAGISQEPSSSSQGSPVGNSPSRHLAPRITLTIGSTNNTTVDLPITDITVLEPGIVSAEVKENRNVLLIGLAKGETIVI